MPSKPVTLVALPDDVLYEILALLLIDTPRSAQRAPVLRTCAHLRAVGLPLLLRVVDLQGYETSSKLASSFHTLFGPGGLLVVGGADLGRHVVKLRLGGTPFVDGNRSSPALRNVDVQQLDAPRLRTLVLNIHYDYLLCPAVRQVLSQLPIEKFIVTERATSMPRSKSRLFKNWHKASAGAAPAPPLNEALLRMPVQPWANLRTVTFRGPHIGRNMFRSPSAWPTVNPIDLHGWSFETLVVDFGYNEHGLIDPERLGDLFFFSPSSAREHDLFVGVKRIEIRAGPTRGKVLRDRAKRERVEVGGMNALTKRVLGIIVLVNKDGKET